MKLTNEEKAKAAVDVMDKNVLLYNGLYKDECKLKIEAIIAILLKSHEAEVREDCANSIDSLQSKIMDGGNIGGFHNDEIVIIQRHARAICLNPDYEGGGK